MPPVLIHQIWLQGLEAAPGNYRDYAESWRVMNRSATHRIWTHADISQLLRVHYPQLAEIYARYPYPVQRADVGRYAILHHCGGLYTDMDSRCDRPIAELLRDAANGDVVLVEGLQYLPIRVALLLERLLSGPAHWPTEVVGNSFLYAPYAGHPLADAILNRLPRAATRRGLNMDHRISRTTGPIFLSRCLFETRREGLVPGHRVLPPQILEGYRTHNVDMNWLRDHPRYRRLARSRLAWEHRQSLRRAGP